MKRKVKWDALAISFVLGFTATIMAFFKEATITKHGVVVLEQPFVGLLSIPMWIFTILFLYLALFYPKR